jgi:arsenite methyltransferase
MSTQHTDQDALREQVRARYAAAALEVAGGQGGCGCGQPADCGCGAGCCVNATDEQPGIGAGLYAADDRAALPDRAVLASLGCGNPTAVAELRPGETVLDLGSGGGIDVLLSARRVGPTGKAYGLDMTEEMLALARANAAEAGVGNVEFLKGRIEAIPLPAGSVDVVISNCVINLSTDKPAVFAETFRVLRPGGRLGVTDVVAEDHLSPAERAERGAWVGCIAGALTASEYRAGLAAAGFADISVSFTHQVGDGLHSAIVRATRPAGGAAAREVPEVLFVCVHNAGRSQMAAALLQHHARGAVRVRSAGSAPAERINPAVVAVMDELGIDLSGELPKPLTGEAVTAADVVVTMGCGDACPVYPGKRYEDWELADPAGQPVEVVRGIRDEIDRRVRRLLAELAPATRAEAGGTA